MSVVSAANIPGANFLPGQVPLFSGPFSMFFEPDTGFLRRVKRGDREGVRAVYGAVRDQNWKTIPPKIENVSRAVSKDGFELSFDAVCQRAPVDFIWRGTITGNETGLVTFRFEGQARSTFLRNRIGLCVLHPMAECAGQPCRVEKIDGTVENGVFPRLISPHQPFTDIRAIRYDVGERAAIEVRFSGEIFEMEDQRNWTDASFKTYGTPLNLPVPVKIEKGTRIEQSVTIAYLGARKQFQVTKVDPVIALTPSSNQFRKPRLGLCLSESSTLTAEGTDLLRDLRLDHLRVDLHLADDQWKSRLQDAVERVKAVGTSLHLALFFSEAINVEFEQLATVLESLRPPISLFLVFRASGSSESSWEQLLGPRLLQVAPHAELALGSNLGFVDLNRNRVTAVKALPCYPITPQVHVEDTLSLIENLEAQASIVETTREFSNRPVVISPVTLKRRLVHRAPAAAKQTLRDGLPSDVDPRQASLFCAGWTLGSIANLSRTGSVHSITYFEITGPRGIMEMSSGSSVPGAMNAGPAGVFPVYHLLAELADVTTFAEVTSGDPLRVQALLCVRESGGRFLLAANMTSVAQEIRMNGPVVPAQIRFLDETNVERARSRQFQWRSGEMLYETSARAFMLPANALVIADFPDDLSRP